ASTAAGESGPFDPHHRALLRTRASDDAPDHVAARAWRTVTDDMSTARIRHRLSRLLRNREGFALGDDDVAAGANHPPAGRVESDIGGIGRLSGSERNAIILETDPARSDDPGALGRLGLATEGMRRRHRL